MEFISSPEAQKASHSIGVVKDIRHLFAKHKAKDLGCCHLILRQPQELKVKDSYKLKMGLRGKCSAHVQVVGWSMRCTTFL